RQSLLDGPALPPPPGVIPEFDHPPNLKTISIAVEITGFLIATITLCIRMYTRIFFAYAALFSFTRAVGDVAPGVHPWDIQLKNVGEFFYNIYIGALLYAPAVFFIRLSIILQYLQIFVPNKEPFKIYLTAQILIWVNVVFYILYIFLMIFGFSPRRKAWDPLVEGGSGFDMVALHVACGAIVAASDLGALILPQISAIFLVGGLLGSTVINHTRVDKTYYTWIEAQWVLPELASGVIVACVPVFPKFFGSLRQTWISSRLSSTLQTLLRRSSRVGSNRSADEASLPHHVTLKPSTGNGIGWPKTYEEVQGGQPGQSAMHSVDSYTITGLSSGTGRGASG
ncbi:MAG: hypothetical protein LQ345_001543, partial [Seirophora villosa]